MTPAADIYIEGETEKERKRGRENEKNKNPKYYQMETGGRGDTQLLGCRLGSNAG